MTVLLLIWGYCVAIVPIPIFADDCIVPVCHEGLNRSQIMLQAVKAAKRGLFVDSDPVLGWVRVVSKGHA